MDSGNWRILEIMVKCEYLNSSLSFSHFAIYGSRVDGICVGNEITRDEIEVEGF